MRVRQVLWAAMAGVASILVAAGPASAALPKADIAVKIQSSGHAKVGGTAMVVTELHNYGPSPTPSATLWVEVKAPGGTIFAYATEKSLQSNWGQQCTWLTAHKHVRCRLDRMFYPDDDNPSSVYTFATPRYSFVVKSRCTTAGRVKYTYGNDPKLSNNSATLRVRVDGVDPASCTAPKPSASPKPSPSASASPSPSAVATVDPSADGVFATSEAPTPDPVTELAGDADSSSSSATMALLGGAAAMILGGGLLVWLRRRSRERTAE
ncbi:MAG: hypothetical protein HOV79_04185 [Hamadaea sp.]|nr:hypothetical protein [Hamadaea sp.]